MKTRLNVLFVFCFAFLNLNSQSYYFPPLQGNTWDTTTPEELGWCSDKIPALYDYLESQDTKAFIVLKDGKIVLEKYFGSFEMDSVWYWASAGKTLTSFIVGLAQEDGKLSLSDTTSKYLGKGWTSLPEDKEDKITIRHQLTMTSGLDDGTGDAFCTDPECLVYKADAGTRWAYHNGPYTLLDEVIKSATGQNLNVYGFTKLFSKTGMSGLFIKSGFNNVFFSKPRTMARFGSLMLNKGTWSNTEILADKNFIEDAINTSQDINLSYGYLWWLNGKESSMVPGTQVVFNRPLFLNAPDDMYSAMGKNGQILNIIPSQNLVMVRMGNFNNTLPVPFLMNDEIWDWFNQVQCTTNTSEVNGGIPHVKIYPNPSNHDISIKCEETIDVVTLYNHLGQKLQSWQGGSDQLHIGSSATQNLVGPLYFEVVLASGKVVRVKHLMLGE